jgi:hypothetical protein
MRTTPRFVPNLRLFKEPEHHPVNTNRFRKSILDAMWFVWLYGILQIVEAFHECGVLPVFFKTP